MISFSIQHVVQQLLGPKHVSLVVWFQQVAWVRSVKTLPVPCRFAGRPGNYVYVFNDYRMEEVCRSKCTRACHYYFFPSFSSAQELYRSSVCVLLPSVCAGRLPHRAVHSAEHHHAGKAADPEQHLWNRHPVSGPHCYFYHVTSVRSSALSQLKRHAECHFALARQTRLPTCLSTLKEQKKTPPI